MTATCVDCGARTSDPIRVRRYGASVPLCDDREACRHRVQVRRLRLFVDCGMSVFARRSPAARTRTGVIEELVDRRGTRP